MKAVLRRYLSGGALDTIFGGGDGTVFLSHSDASGPFPWSLRIAPDGKIVLAGHHWTRTPDTIVNGQVVEQGDSNQDFGVYRFNADGSVDAGFGGGDGIALADFGGSDEAMQLPRAERRQD